MQQQFRAKISKISELEKHSHESITEETEKEDPMLPNILRDTESYHLVIGKAFENVNHRPRLTVRLSAVDEFCPRSRAIVIFKSLKGFILLVALLALYIYYCEKRKRRLSAQV